MKKVAHWEDYHFEQDRLLDAVDDEDGRINCSDDDSTGYKPLCNFYLVNWVNP